MCLQEMDLIYDMRGHMEQLYQEMSELRKSIKSCMDMQMQMQLQKSNNQRVQTGLYSLLQILNVLMRLSYCKVVNESLGISSSSISLRISQTKEKEVLYMF
jgi:hypothetical protein